MNCVTCGNPLEYSQNAFTDEWEWVHPYGDGTRCHVQECPTCQCRPHPEARRRTWHDKIEHTTYVEVAVEAGGYVNPLDAKHKAVYRGEVQEHQDAGYHPEDWEATMTGREAVKTLFRIHGNAIGTFNSTPIAAMWNDGTNPVELSKWQEFHSAVMALVNEYQLWEDVPQETPACSPSSSSWSSRSWHSPSAERRS